MALRVVQASLPADADVSAVLDERRVLTAFVDCRDNGRRIVQIAVGAEEAEGLVDELEGAVGEDDDFEVAVFSIEALVPRPSEDPHKEGEVEEAAERDRISRDELYADVTEGLAVSPTYLALAALASVVAAIGLLRDDVAVIIGAMVIAPLLQPAVALSLAATSGDLKLGIRAFLTGGAGLLASLVPALVLGWIFDVDPTLDEIAARSSADLGDLGLALAAGAAGTLAFTRGLSGAVLGVMVAVAILPPLTAFGLFLASGNTGLAIGAAILTAGNLVCINLAGVATFLLQGLRPRGWDEKRLAKRTTLVAIAVWLLLLGSIVAIVLFAGLGEPSPGP